MHCGGERLATLRTILVHVPDDDDACLLLVLTLNVTHLLYFSAEPAGRFQVIFSVGSLPKLVISLSLCVSFSARATVMNFFRVPLNLIVVVILLQVCMETFLSQLAAFFISDSYFLISSGHSVL